MNQQAESVVSQLMDGGVCSPAGKVEQIKTQRSLLTAFQTCAANQWRLKRKSELKEGNTGTF